MRMKKERAQYISSRDMRALEVNAEYYGITLLQLMENAGRNIADEIASRFTPEQEIAIFCGLGGNGGDGFVATRHLVALGYRIAVVLAGRIKNISHPAALQNICSLKSLKGIIGFHGVTDSSAIPNVQAEIVVDALLGTGTKGKLRPPIAQLVDYINSLNSFKIAVDGPTGIDSDSGEVLGKAVKADVTITFHKAKPGLEKAKKYVGELIVKTIGLPEELESYAGPGDVHLVTKPRPPNVHKGDFGRLLVIGGNKIFSGAPTLVSLAALRTGVDLVYVAAPRKTARAISALSPDLITVKLRGNHLNPKNLQTLKPYIEMVDAVVLGPGAGLHSETEEFIKECVDAVESAGKPLLLDADGLKAFSKFKRPLRVPLVLTPHAGEYALLSHKQLPSDLSERICEVKKTAVELNSVVLLKGATDLICDGCRTKLNFSGNPGMTVGGTGDVLAGIIGAFLAKNNDGFEAAVAGAFVNGAAGDFVANEVGFHMMATDLINWIPNVLNDPISHAKVRHNNAIRT